MAFFWVAGRGRLWWLWPVVRCGVRLNCTPTRDSRFRPAWAQASVLHISTIEAMRPVTNLLETIDRTAG